MVHVVISCCVCMGVVVCVCGYVGVHVGMHVGVCIDNLFTISFLC